MNDPNLGPPNPILTNEQRDRFQQHINKKTALIGKCAVCSQRNWGILDHLVHTPIFYPGGSMVIGGPAYPYVGLICQNCGNTQLMNAVAAGVVDGMSTPPDGQNGGKR